MVVKDSLKALEWYENIFGEVKRVEVTNFERGENEAIFTLYDVRFHLLDENPEFLPACDISKVPSHSSKNVESITEKIRNQIPYKW